MPYRRQRKAAMQVMQNLGDGTSQRRGRGREILGQSSALACRQNGTVTAERMQRLAKQHTSKLQLAASAVRAWRQYARGGTPPRAPHCFNPLSKGIKALHSVLEKRVDD